MLVLSRRIEERIVIGDRIVLTVLSVQGNRVRIGIEAPVHVSVDRQEVRQRKVVEGDRLSPAGRPHNRSRQQEKIVEESYASASY